MCSPNLKTRPPGRRTVDALTRTLHALLALCFVGAYLSGEAEHGRALHVTFGYTLAGLFGARIAWGLFGPRRARLDTLVGKLRAWHTLHELMRHGARGRPLQNLWIATSVALLLACMAPLAASGYIAYAEWTGDWIGEVHEAFGKLMLFAVLAHVGGLLAFSLLRRRNLLLPMLSGRSREPGPDLVRRNHRPLALALVAVIVAFWVWQWHRLPSQNTATRPDFAAEMAPPQPSHTRSDHAHPAR